MLYQLAVGTPRQDSLGQPSVEGLVQSMFQRRIQQLQSQAESSAQDAGTLAVSTQATTPAAAIPHKEGVPGEGLHARVPKQ
jgi:hypothetical protein